MTTLDNRRSVMILYCEADSLSSHFVRLVIAEKDIAVEIEIVDPDRIPEDLILLNPYGTLPTLVDRDLVLYGPRVIADYLDERYPHPPFMPIDPVSRAKTRLALYRIENDWYSLVEHLDHGSGPEFDAARKMLTESLVASADVFAAKPYFLSDEYSMLDATLAPLLWRFERYGIKLPKQAAVVSDYANRLFDRSGFRKSVAEPEHELTGA